MSKKQATLAAFGFTKSVLHWGQETVIEMPKTVSNEAEYKLEAYTTCNRSKLNKDFQFT